MFEESLLSAHVADRDRSMRVIMFGSAVLQCVVATGLAVYFVASPATLSLAPALLRVPLAVHLRRVVERPPQRTATPASLAVQDASIAAPRAETPVIPRVEPQSVPTSDLPALWAGTPAELPAMFGAGLCGPVVAVAPARSSSSSATVKAARVRVSSGVSSGLLLAPIRPVYPRLAAAAHVEGTVVVAALISATGEMVGARVVSGSSLLASAALEAVRAARYRPYLLNGEPTAVETTVTIVFRLGGG